MLIVSETGLLLNLCCSNGESLENLADVGTLLHGDDTKLVLLIHPDEEGLCVVVEDTTSLGPVVLKTAGFKIFVTTLEEEVISDKLVPFSIGHGSEGVVLALEFSSEGVEGRDNLRLNLTALLSSDASAQGVVSEVTGNADSS